VTSQDLVDQFYLHEHFEKGKSRKVDEAIAGLLQVFHPKLDSGKFETMWQEFLGALLSEFPNISIYNLVSIHMPLIAHGLHRENLQLYRFIVELNPQSAESQCFLGHAYREVGDLESAAACYQRAYDLQMSLIAERHLSPTNPNCLDACGYLCFLADAENELRRRADALVHATRALSMLREVSVEHELRRVYEVLHKIFLGMELTDLAKHCRRE